MVIRREQIHALSTVTERQFEIDVADFLTKHLLDASCDSIPPATALVGVKIARARQYGLTTERQLVTYVICAWVLGDDFEFEYYPAAQILESELSAEVKRGWLEQFVRYTVVGAAEREA